MSIRPQVVYSVLGACFALAGVFTLLNVAAAWNFPHVVLWAGLLYCVLDFIIAWGFLQREKWLCAALIVNAAGMVVLFGARFAAEIPAESGWTLAGLALNLALAWYVYATRRTPMRRGIAAAVLFYIVWISMFGYTMYITFL